MEKTRPNPPTFELASASDPSNGGKHNGNLLSFENPIYGNVSEGYGEDSSDRNGSDDDLRIYGDRKCPRCLCGGKLSGKCVLIVSTMVVLVLVATTVALGVYYGTKDHLPPMSSESQSSTDETSYPTVSINEAKVSKHYQVTMRIVQGPHSTYYTAYKDHGSAQFGTLSTILTSIFNDLYRGTAMKDIFIDATLNSVEKGSLIVRVQLDFKEYVLVYPTKPRSLNYSSVDINKILLKATTPQASNKNKLKLDELIMDKTWLKIEPMHPIPYNMIGKPTTTKTTTVPTTTTTTTSTTTRPLPTTPLTTRKVILTFPPTVMHTTKVVTRRTTPRSTTTSTRTTTTRSTTTTTTTTSPRTSMLIHTERSTRRPTTTPTTTTTTRTTTTTTPRTTTPTPRPTTRLTTKMQTMIEPVITRSTIRSSSMGTAGANRTTVVTPRYTGPTYIPQSSQIPPGVNISGPCLPGYYHCPEGVITLPDHRDYCIGIREKCDGMVDCKNGQDEENCGEQCTGGGFRCRTPGSIDRIYTGFCTLRNAHCDGRADCTDRSDEWNCTCPTGDFRCISGYDVHNGDECVSQSYQCDRERDCSDGSDEVGCDYSCPDGFFMCAGGTVNRPVTTGAAHLRFCIQANEVCDGHVDCLDASDEPDCLDDCPRGKFRCSRENATVTGRNTSCYLESDRCDRHVDCTDGSDEFNCTYECPDPGQMFQCATGVIGRYPYVGFCLYPYEKCNGVEECDDGSDEADCPGLTCTELEFKCTMGTEEWEDDQCIPIEHRCDRVEDCSNSTKGGRSEDEEGCEYVCPLKGTFICHTDTVVPMIADAPGRGFCLRGEKRCDGMQDCVDNSDEEDCNTTCDANHFKCASGVSIHDSRGSQCIPRRYMCDREADCTDSSDEPANCVFNCTDNMRACKEGILLRWPHTGFCIYQREWCDGYQDCVDNSDEQNCRDTTCAPDQFQCINRQDIYYGNGCLENHARCDHQVHCLDGSDEDGCTYDCPLGQFQCGTGQNITAGQRPGECLHIERRCDGVVDCLDGTDEIGCNRTCDIDQFHCKNGTSKLTGDVCIDSSFHCDRAVDCSDGSDEGANCTYTCDEGRFACASGTTRWQLEDPEEDRGYCIPDALYCNGIKDCNDGSDEVNCTKCEDDQFACINGTASRGNGFCIPGRFKCDKDLDCTDGSDEVGCNYTCPDGQVACKAGTLLRWPFYGYCIPLRDLCDGYEDCNDRSDEEDCDGDNCNAAQFKCENGTDVADGNSCIHMSYRCDRAKDCTDLSDETSCNYTCPEGQFMCKTGTTDVQPPRGFCLYERFRCDGQAQCLDRSDEDDCEVKCDEGKVPCDAGVSIIHGSTCIRTEWVCDREADCVDASDEKNCTYGCPNGELSCTTGILSRWPFFGFCYPASDHCDGFKDCEDGSDEADCDEPDVVIPACPGRQFRCANVTGDDDGLCIPDVMRCDRALDCMDGSDELGCNYTCPDGSFMCETGAVTAWPQRGYCIPSYHLCDGLTHCADNSDEATCNGTCAVSGFFRCKSGVNNYTQSACISPSDRCDGKADCPDASDESDCPTYNVSCPPHQTQCKQGIQWYFQHVQHTDNLTGCLNKTEICDGFVDCADHSDELNCSLNCSATEFRCGDPQIILGSVCISGNKYCDGRQDCRNGIDERCPGGQPPALPAHFYCQREPLYMLPFSARCNGVPDCQDGSDEEFC